MTGFASWLRCSNVGHRRPTKLFMMYGRLLGCCTIYTFSMALAPPDGISPRAKFTLRPSLALSILAALHGVYTRRSPSAGEPYSNGVCVYTVRSPRRSHRVNTPLLYGTPAEGVSQTLRRGTRNGITELSQEVRAPPIFGWAAITLGIGPHSSWLYFTQAAPPFPQTSLK